MGRSLFSGYYKFAIIPMDRWKFLSYISGSGRDVVEEWCEDNPGLQATLDAALKYLREQPRDQWRRPYFDQLGRECTGLGEVRFKDTRGRVQWRVLGFFGRERGQFTIVLVAKEKDNAFVPRNACRLGLERKALIEGDWSRVKEYELD